MNVEEKLRTIVAKKVKISFDDSTRLSELGLDSLDVIEIAFDIEDELKIELPQMGGEMLSVTVGDLRRLVEERLEAKTGAAPAMPDAPSAASA